MKKIKRSARRLKRKGLDDTIEINVGRPTLKRSVEESNMGKASMDEDYLMFLKILLLKSEPSSSHEEGDGDVDEDDDRDPQYMMFLNNLRKCGGSYELEIATKKRRVSVMYEAENDSSDNCGMLSRVEPKKTLKNENVEAKEDRNICIDGKRVRCNVMKTRQSKSKAAKYMENSQIRERIGTRNRPRMCNDVLESRKILGIKRERETHNFPKEDLKSVVVKDSKNPPRRMERKTRKRLRRDGCKHVEITKRDMENNRGREKERRVKKGLKSSCSKHANNDQPKTQEASGKIHREKWNSAFESNWQQQLNADDLDGCYRVFLNSVKTESDCVVYAVDGKRPVKLDKFDKLEQFDVECSSDSEIFVTSNASDLNEGGYNPFQTSKLIESPENGSVFRKKLMSKLGEPYNDEEYGELWDEFHEERPKVKHIDLRGSGAEKQLVCDELSPSYRATYAHCADYNYLWIKLQLSLSFSHSSDSLYCSSPERKLLAVGRDQYKRLQLLRGFFFWLQNLAHDDAFQPWFDKTCLEMIQKQLPRHS